MAEPDNQGQGTASWWKRLEKLRHPNFRRRLEGVGESEKTVRDSGDKALVDHLEAELIKLAIGDENPAVRDAACRPVLQWGGPLALGMGVAVGAAYIAAKVWHEQRLRSQQEIEKILNNPAAFGPKQVLRVAEEAIRLGKGGDFLNSLLTSLANNEVNLKVRRDLIASINPHSSLGAELYKNEALCLVHLDKMPSELKEALRKLLRQARETHSERDKLKGLDLNKIH
jgi:hypothetical protein